VKRKAKERFRQGSLARSVWRFASSEFRRKETANDTNSLNPLPKGVHVE